MKLLIFLFLPLLCFGQNTYITNSIPIISSNGGGNGGIVYQFDTVKINSEKWSEFSLSTINDINTDTIAQSTAVINNIPIVTPSFTEFFLEEGFYRGSATFNFTGSPLRPNVELEIIGGQTYYLPAYIRGASGHNASGSSTNFWLKVPAGGTTIKFVLRKISGNVASVINLEIGYIRFTSQEILNVLIPKP